MDPASNRKEVPVDLARAGEARHFIACRGVAGAGLTDILLSAEDGVLGL